MSTPSRSYLQQQPATMALPPPTTALPPPPLPPGPPPSDPPPPMPSSATKASSLGRSPSASSSSVAAASARPSSRSTFGSLRSASQLQHTSQARPSSPYGSSSAAASARKTSAAVVEGLELAPRGPSAAAGAAAVAESASPYLASSAGGEGSSLDRAVSQQGRASHFSSGPPLPSASAAASSSSGSGAQPSQQQQRMPSRTLLQQALSLAQQAVLLDQESQFADALVVYQTTVGLLEKVMDRVEAGERRRRERGQSTSGGAGEEEGRTLRGIYDAYTSRIALLSEQLDHETPLSSPALSPLSITHPYQQSYAGSQQATSNRYGGQGVAVDGSQHQQQMQRADQAAAYDGIGSAMLSTSSSSSTSLASPTTATAVAVPYHRPRPPSQLSASSSHSRNQSFSGPSAGGPDLTTAAASHQRSTSHPLGSAPSAGPVPPPAAPLADGAEADLRRQSLLDSLELSLGPPGSTASGGTGGLGRRPSGSASGLLLEGVVEAPEGTEGGGVRAHDGRSSSASRQPTTAFESDSGRSSSRTAGVSGQILLDTTSGGTISQRRKAGNGSGGGAPDLSISGGSSSAQSSSLELDRSKGLPPVLVGEPLIASSSTVSSTTPSPTPHPTVLADGPSPRPMLKEKTSMFRLRALSQPGRRPTNGASPADNVPPVPVIQRKASFPAQPSSSGAISPGRSLGPFGIGRSASSSGAGGGGGPAGASLRSTSARSAASSREGFDHYGGGSSVVPPSPSVSVHSAFNVLGSKTPVGRLTAVVGTAAHQPLAPERPPADLALRPFHLMRLLRRTMTTPGGAYLSKRMHVAPETWTLMGVHLPAVDVKVEAIQQLSDGLLALERVGAPLLGPAQLGTARVQEVGREWAKALEAFERLIDDLQLTLGKKLSMEFGGHVKKSSGSIMGLGNKLTRVMEKKFSSGRNVNTVYVEDLNRLFAQAQCLDEHLRSFPSLSSSGPALATSSSPSAAAYRALTPSSQMHIEQRLRRSAEFFGQVIVVFVLRDLGLLMDKYAKSVDKWLMD